MRKYEVPILVKPLLPEDVKTKVIPTVETAVSKLGGKMKVKLDWGKRHLAYPIKGHEEGYYIFLELECDPSKISRLERELRLIRDILRFLVIKEDQL